MGQYTFVNDADVPVLAEAVVDVLKKVGVFCQNEEILDALEGAGAKVDRKSQVAKFPKTLTRKFVSQLRKECGKPKPLSAQPFPDVGLPRLGTQIAQFVHDYKTGEKRSGNSQDFIELIKFGAALEDGAVGHCLLLTDVDPMIEPLEAAMLLAEYAPKPGATFAWNIRQVPYLKEMGEILGKEDWYTWGACCYAHPLRFDKDVADKFIPRAHTRSGAGLTAMPVAAVTTPVTTAGFIVVSAAEMVATWISGRAVNPDVSLYGGMWAASMDMKSGEVSYCLFDAMRHGFAMAEFMKKWTGMTVNIGGGEYSDAKVPGYYAALEKAYKALTIAAFTGRHPGIGQGMLEQGKTLSPVQLLLEREMSTGVNLWAKQVEVSPNTIGLDTIVEVGHGLDKNYIDRDHTLEHFRNETWLPPITDRSGYTGPEQEKAVLDKFQDKVDELIAGYQKPDVDPAKLAKMREVVDRAKRELLD